MVNVDVKCLTTVLSIVINFKRNNLNYIENNFMYNLTLNFIYLINILIPH